MPTPLAFILLAFLFGLLIGSFLNVCISRLPRRESVVSPRSRCPGCSTPIRWYDNIPLLSFILLRARCRHCKQPIAWRYLLVELATGLWFAVVTLLALHASLVGLYVQQTVAANISILLSAVALLTLGSLLIALLVIDWQHHLLPDALTWPGILLGLLFTCAQAALLPDGQGDIHFAPRHNLRLSSPGSSIAKGDVFLTGTEHLILGRVLATVVAALLLLGVRWIYQALRHREGLGLGDAKLLALLAAFLGLAPAFLALFVGVILASLYALALLARRRAHALTALPLGSFLALGGLFAALFAPPLIAWYKSLL